ncbi:MAG TPA: MarR family transcriptional regulator [Firmicutes bacterium]|nr:MarR family transcriptional regulator [Bacillota bacterium]
MSRDDALGFLLGRAIRLHYRRSQQLYGDSGLHPGQIPIMFALWREDGQIQKELAKRLHLSAATVTVSLKRLEKAGLLERRRDQDDQRQSRVFLTERGRALHQEVLESLRITDRDSLAGFSAAETAQFKQYLHRVIDNLLATLGVDGQEDNFAERVD